MNYYVGGLSPYGYHVVNIVLHTGVTLLFMQACRQVAPHGNNMEPVLAGAIFAVHPVHVEAVWFVQSYFGAIGTTLRNFILCQTVVFITQFNITMHLHSAEALTFYNALCY